MSEEQAHAESGKFAARIMGDRTKGANAMFYNSKLFNVVGQFQLEVNNQLYSMFYDTYHESKEKAKRGEYDYSPEQLEQMNKDKDGNN